MQNPVRGGTRGVESISVAHLVYSLHIGGSEKVAFDIAANLDRDRFDSYVCALDCSGELTRDLDRVHVPHHVFNRQGLELDVCRRIYRFLRTRRIDIVHTHHFTQLLFAAFPARLAGARLVHTEHEFFSYTQSALSRHAVPALLRFCDAMTVVGPAISEYFINTLGIPRSRITVVPNGVDIGAFGYDSGAARRELAIAPDELVLGTVGRLEPEKDQITLLNVFAGLLTRRPRSRLVIVGDGSLRDELTAHAERLGIAGAVRFLGVRRDIAKILAALDIFVLTSIREGLPISLLEAMAARRPVVASDIGSVRDLVVNGETGLLVPAGSVDGFAAAVARLAGDPGLRQRLADGGRRTVEGSFSLRAAVQSYERLYEAAIARHVRN